MTLDHQTVPASSPDGRMLRFDLGGDDGYAVGDFFTIAGESGGRQLDQPGGVATGSMLPGWRGAGASRPFRVLDIGPFPAQDEQLAVALAVFDDLWRCREERRPLLIVVVDEAHNVCSPDLESTAARAVRQHIIQIAAEGRKFGRWLLMSRQRPSKVHPQIVSQRDTLTLMWMHSRNDVADLVAGGFVPAPSIIRFRDRITHEGGIDVPVPMPGD